MSDDILLALLQPIIDRVRTDVSAVKVIGGEMWRSDDALTRARLVRHLHGAQVRGAYLIKPGESTVRAAVLDLDDHAKAWPWDAVATVAQRIMRVAAMHGLHANAWSSSSGHGVHLWFLWDEPQDAHSVREALACVLAACMLKNGSGGLDKGEVEIFPKQDSVDEGAYGNQVWLPLGGISRPLEPDLIDGTLRPAPLEWLVNVYDVGGWDWVMSSPVEFVEAAARVSASVDVTLWDEARWTSSLREWRAQLEFVKDYSYERWMEIGFALHDGSGGSADGLALWEEWSARGPEYEAGACADKWRSMGSGKASSVSIRTLAFRARAGGWVEELPFEDISASSGVLTDPILQNHPPFERNPSSRILPTTSNIMMVLDRPDLTGMEVALDGFTDDVMLRRCAAEIWRGFTDEDYTALKLAMENRGRGFLPIARAELRECLRAKAKENIFDSAQLWLDGLVWDGRPRVERFLSSYWGAQDTEYTRAVALYMWTAMAGRVAVPGHQVDMVPILVGNQGAGKTQGIKALSDEARFCELSFDMKDDDVARKLRGVLVAEIAELRGLGTRDEESIKAFVTRQTEKWVPKWKEFAGTFKRRVVMYGTTNDTEFLGDITGNRRWLPFNVGARAGRRDEDVRPDLVALDRAQLWAEARELFKTHGVLWEEAETLAKGEHAAFMTSHPWEDAINEWVRDYEEVCLKGSDTIGTEDLIFVSNNQILSSALHMSGRVSGADGRALAKVMTKLGFRKMTRDCGRVRGWGRPKTPL